jgi:N-acetylglucosamine-6-phosphate deacetylase
MDGTPEAFRTAIACHTRHGTTTIFPTTTTGSREQVRAMLDAAIACRDSWQASHGARIAGVHFYGPYFAEDKVGCHLKSGRRDPDPSEYLASFDLGIVRVATCAAELPGAEAFYREAQRRGCFITCGHSNSSWGEMAQAYAAGMRHVDHFWCVMSSVSSLRDRFQVPMQASMEQFVLAMPEMSTEVIADGCHLSPELLDFAFLMKGPKRLCLVTDASRAVDMPPGDYRFGPATDGEWFTSNGQVGHDRVLGKNKLASSIAGMDRVIRQMKRDTRATLPEVIRMASLTPAERTGIAGDVGSLEPGKRADLVILSRELAVERVFVAGEAFAG